MSVTVGVMFELVVVTDVDNVVSTVCSCALLEG